MIVSFFNQFVCLHKDGKHWTGLIDGGQFRLSPAIFLISVKVSFNFRPLSISVMLRLLLIGSLCIAGPVLNSDSDGQNFGRVVQSFGVASKQITMLEKYL